MTPSLRWDRTRFRITAARAASRGRAHAVHVRGGRLDLSPRRVRRPEPWQRPERRVHLRGSSFHDSRGPGAGTPDPGGGLRCRIHALAGPVAQHGHRGRHVAARPARRISGSPAVAAPGRCRCGRPLHPRTAVCRDPRGSHAGRLRGTSRDAHTARRLRWRPPGVRRRSRRRRIAVGPGGVVARPRAVGASRRHRRGDRLAAVGHRAHGARGAAGW